MTRETVPDIRAFEIEGFHGEVSSELAASNLEPAIAELVTPSATSETLHWGRNYLFSATLELADALTEVVVKQFRNQSWKARIERRLKGSKAERSWRAARAMQRAGVPTPRPLVWIESDAPAGPSFFVSERLSDAQEARYLFRALEAGEERQRYPGIDLDRLIEKIALTIRRLHDAGIWHRDLSIGNVLLVGPAAAADLPEVYFIDLNRSRLRERLTRWQRTRDLCRLRIFRRHHRQIFLAAYWAEKEASLRLEHLLYRICFRSFLFRRWIKDTMRRPFRSLRELVLPRHPHVHIPRPADEATIRNRVVWDELSDQPHQHATRFERLLVRIADAPLHGREIATGLAALPAVRRRYRELRERLYREPIRWGGMGVALRPWLSDPEAQIEALQDLGPRRILLRLHPWQEDHDAEETLARALHERGFELAFVLPQNRDLVVDLGRWRAAVAELDERFSGFGSRFQVGQAINRSKWGIWNHREYLDLVATASEILRRRPGTEILGPAVIDYEPIRTMAMVNLAPQGVYFDALASLLYVDRRGAPENRQLGFDTVDKVLQLKAIAETAKGCGKGSWITETNWPLWEGPHSPAGRKVAVDEETQASYLVRYFLLTLGTGAVERVYWWQLVARGYGLCFEDSARRLVCRPSYRACATLYRYLEGATFVGPLAGDPRARLYHFRDLDEREVVVGWTTDDSVCEIDLPRPVEHAVDRDGVRIECNTVTRVEIRPSPRYFWLRSE